MHGFFEVHSFIHFAGIGSAYYMQGTEEEKIIKLAMTYTSFGCTLGRDLRRRG